MSGKKRRKIVLVGGTFQYIHPGHIHFLKKAAELGDVNVVVSRDGNAKRARGGERVVPERLRLAQVQSLRIVKRAVLGGKKGILGGIAKIMPDIIFLGPDQPKIAEIRKTLSKISMKKPVKIARLKRKFGRFSSSAIIDSLDK